MGLLANYLALMVFLSLASIDCTVEILLERREKRELTSSEEAEAFLMCLVRTDSEEPNLSVSAEISRRAARIWPARASILEPSKDIIIARR